MVKAIIYTTNTGNTEKYAKLLSGQTGLPAYTLEEAKEKADPGTEVIYLGWVMAGGIQGYKEAAKQYKVRVACAVSMGPTGSLTEETRKKNAIPSQTAVFTLQGGLDLTKLHGMYKLAVSMITKKAAKTLSAKNNRTLEEDSMLDILLHGGCCVSEENLKSVLEWYEAQR